MYVEPTVVVTAEKVCKLFQTPVKYFPVTTNCEMNEQTYAVPECPSAVEIAKLLFISHYTIVYTACMNTLNYVCEIPSCLYASLVSCESAVHTM